MRGGKVLVFVDPHSEAQAMRQQQPGMAADTFSNLEKLFPAWGIDFDPTASSATRRRRVRWQFPSGGRAADGRLSALAVARPPPSGRGSEVVTAELDRVNLATAGALAAREGATTTFTPLITLQRRGDGHSRRQGPALSRSHGADPRLQAGRQGAGAGGAGLRPAQIGLRRHGARGRRHGAGAPEPRPRSRPRSSSSPTPTCSTTATGSA